MIKPYKLNESVVAITKTSCVYLLTCVWVFCFLKVKQFNLSLTLALNYTKATRIRVGLVNGHFWILILRMACNLHVVETYIKGISRKRCYLVTSSRLINVYFTNQVSILLISAEIKNWKSHYFFFGSTYFWSSRSQMFFKGGILKSYAIFTGKHLRRSHFFIKSQSVRPATLKVTPMKVFYCDYCKIFKNSFFHRTLPLVDSITCERRSYYFKIWHNYFYLKILICKFWLTDWLFSCSQKTREGIIWFQQEQSF